MSASNDSSPQPPQSSPPASPIAETPAVGMAEEKRVDVPGPSAGAEETSRSHTLRDTIRSSREFLNRTVVAARTHSPFAEDKLEAADEAVAGAIHSGYQALKRLVVNGHPAITLTAAGVAAAVPSIPFGGRTMFRNSGLAIVLASIMIYPDHLRTSFVKTTPPQDSSSKQS